MAAKTKDSFDKETAQVARLGFWNLADNKAVRNVHVDTSMLSLNVLNVLDVGAVVVVAVI